MVIEGYLKLWADVSFNITVLRIIRRFSDFLEAADDENAWRKRITTLLISQFNDGAITLPDLGIVTILSANGPVNIISLEAEAATVSGQILMLQVWQLIAIRRLMTTRDFMGLTSTDVVPIDDSQLRGT